MLQPNNKRKYVPGRLFFFLLFASAAALVFGAVVMLLWNAVLPPLLNVRTITYWQAVALFVLCKILFGNFRPFVHGGRPSFGGSPSHWREKWMKMSDEEKSKFKQEWKKRCEQRKG